ncbi:hypothetical protein [Maribacter sp. 2307UL18-2]|uniref:hypothetical protein n=1 Tax=Maribacter sp. 2307UL18-2 TaxID=3386274 RepID=UPI0039BD592F
MGYIIFGLILAYSFWFFIANADLKPQKIKAYLESKKLDYVRHKEVFKPLNKNFEIGEGIFTWLHFRKHHYTIDAIDKEGNPVVVNALFYQNVSLLYRNRVFFNIEES